MVVKGEALAIVFDVGKSKHGDENYATYIEDSKECIRMIIQRKIFSESKDEIALILCGCKDTDNIDDDNNSEYENISILESLQPATWKLFDVVDDIQGTNVLTDSIRDTALEIAVNLLQNSVNPKKLDSRRILLISNFDGFFKGSKIEMIFDDLKAHKIDIDLLGPTSFSNVVKKELCDDEMGNQTHISGLLREVGGDSYNFSCISPILRDYLVKKTQPYPMNLTLSIGTLSIPISVTIKTTECKTKTWETACAHDVNIKPRRITTYCMNDESQSKVSIEDTIQAYKYGTTLVPFSEVDKKNMDYQAGDKGMLVLGFTKKDSIQRFLFAGDKTRYVSYQKKDESGAEALAAFIQALEEKEKVAIVRYVATARSSPVMGFLYPRISPVYECLIFIPLPFLEDIRHLSFASLTLDKKNIPTDKQLDAIDKLIDAMDMNVEDDTEEEYYSIKNTVNPYPQRLFQCLQYKLHHPEKPLPDIAPHIQAIVDPTPKLLKRAESPLKAIKSLFPIKESVSKKLPGSAHVFAKSNSDTSIKNEDVPEAKFDSADCSKLVDVMADKITQVGSINPLRDIQYLVNNKILPFNTICEQINDVLDKLLQDTDRVRFSSPKILSICKEYRSSSLKEGDCEKYNSFMLSLVRVLKENEELWNKFRDEKLTLITKEELPSSTKTSEEAELFLARSTTSAELDLESAVPDNIFGGADDDEEDLMDML